MKCRREAPTSSRSEVLVVRSEGSCLEVLRSEGINDGGIGCGKWGKKRLYDRNGRVMVVQRIGPLG